MKNIFAYIFFWILLAASAVYAFNYAIMIPDVYFSYSKDQCIQVVNYSLEDKYSCENLPTKFNHIWVE